MGIASSVDDQPGAKQLSICPYLLIKFVLICLSSEYFSRPWPEAELNAAFSLDNSAGTTGRVLPLILNSKERILQTYPILAGLAYREYKNDPQRIAGELASLTNKENGALPVNSDDIINVRIESVNTGQISNLRVSPRSSIKWLSENARISAGLKESLDTGSFERFFLRWVLVDAKALVDWSRMSHSEAKSVWAVVKAEEGLAIATRGTERLAEIGVTSDITFHLCGVIIPDPKNPSGGSGEHFHGILYDR